MNQILNQMYGDDNNRKKQSQNKTENKKVNNIDDQRENENIGYENNAVGFENNNVGFENNNVSYENNNVGYENNNVGYEYNNVANKNGNVVEKNGNTAYGNNNTTWGNNNSIYEGNNTAFENNRTSYYGNINSTYGSNNEFYENENRNVNYQNRNKNEVPKVKQKEKNKNIYKNKADIVKVGKFFSIALIIFGVILISKSVYALTNDSPKKHDTIQVSTEKMGREVTISIASNLPIREFSYKWNTGEATTITGDGTVNMEKTIDIPNGNNILNIEVIDNYGNSTSYMKQYIYESKDAGKPTIELSKSGGKLIIKATDDTKMGYLTYAWNNDEATRIDAEKGEKELSAEVEVPKGENKLSIVAVDAEQNRQTRNETIVGATKPTFTISTDGSNIIISAKDEIGIDSIIVNVDGKEMSTGNALKNQKEVEAKIPSASGTHNISVTVKNTSGLEETKTISVSI